MYTNKIDYYNKISDFNNNKKCQDIFDWLIQCTKATKYYQDYTLDSYFKIINNGLRYDTSIDFYSEEIIKQMDRIFETMPQSYCVKMPEIVYRGIRAEDLPKELINIITLKDKTKNTFTDKAFVSTTRNEAVAKSFKGKDGYILKITLPTGTKRIKSEDFHSKMESEEEITLPRNSRFRIDLYNQKTRTVHVTYLGQDYPLPEVHGEHISEVTPYSKSYIFNKNINLKTNKYDMYQDIIFDKL